MSNKKESVKTKEPVFDVAQLAMVEMYTPKMEETIKFFEVIGMIVVHKDDAGSVYLRAYEDPYMYSTKLTPRAEPGMGVASFRASSPQALERRVEVLSALPEGKGWKEAAYGRGKAYQFDDPEGHPFELFFDVDYYEAPTEWVSKLNNRPQKRPLIGIPVRRLDHINVLGNDIDKNSAFFKDALGFREREILVDDKGVRAASWLAVSSLVHEIAMMKDDLGAKKTEARMHHIAYWYGAPEDLEHLADALTELSIPIEAGPIKHGVSQAKCMYVIEPGGNRIELFGDTGYLIFDPTFETVKWSVADKDKAIIWYGAELPHSYFRYGTPIIDDDECEPFYPKG